MPHLARGKCIISFSCVDIHVSAISFQLMHAHLCTSLYPKCSQCMGVLGVRLHALMPYCNAHTHINQSTKQLKITLLALKLPTDEYRLMLYHYQHGVFSMFSGLGFSE